MVTLNAYLFAVVALILLDYVVGLVVDLLNVRHTRTEIPDEFEDWYDEEAYARSQRYLKDTTRFHALSETMLVPLYLVFIVAGGFRWVDELARAAGGGMIVTGLVFAGILILLGQLIQVPFSIYSTFVLEERYGFNKTTPATFIADRLKGLGLTVLIGGPVFAGILWFFASAGEVAWLYSWGAVTLFQCLILYVAPAVILPLFNTFTPIEEGELKEEITAYARKEGFKVGGIFAIDGSRRSTKSNAYFTGFGRWRRIALFDTLIEKHSVRELVAVLAHEVGHYKLRHIHKQLAASFLSTGLMFFLLSQFISREGLYHAFGLAMEPVQGEPPIYAGMVFFGFLYTPISMILGIVQGVLSRRHEYEADAFAVETSGYAAEMVTALKKLAVDNLTNLTPHPLKVFVDYSHPPVLERVRAIRQGAPV